MPYLPRFARKAMLTLFMSSGSRLQGLTAPVLGALVGVYPQLFVSIPDDVTGNVVIEERRFLFVPLPKNASTSFHTGFREYSERVGLKARIVESSFSSLLAENFEYDSYFKATFVRNPYSRVVSVYHQQIRDPHPSAWVRIFPRFERYGLRPGMSFSEFAEWLGGPYGGDDLADKHWMSQHRLLGFNDGRHRLDFVGRLENKQEELERLCELSGLEGFRLPLPPSKGIRSHSLEGAYRDYYDGNSKRTIAKRYEEDLQLLEYGF